MAYRNNDVRGDIQRDDNQPRTNDGFDTRDSKVRMHSIGWLDENYLQHRSILQPGYASDQFTRIPPLASMPDIQPVPIKDRLTKPILSFLSATLAGTLTALAWLSLSAKQGWRYIYSALPKSYSWSKGVFVDWPQFRLRALRATEPLLILGCLVFGVVLLSTNSSIHHNQPSSPTNNSSKSNNVSRSKNNANQPKSSTPSSKTSTASTSNKPSSSITSKATNNGGVSSSANSTPGYYLGPSTPSTTSLTPGMGGGGGSSSYPSTSSTYSGSSTSSPTSAPSSSSTSTSGTTSSGTGSSVLPLNVTTPPVNSSLGGKTLLNTSPTTVTVN